MERCGVTPYEGGKGYIFISYSHKDGERVYPVLERLAEKGYRVWYDEGINPGSEWPENIADHLGRSVVCMGFISEYYLGSDNCRRELNFALMKHIPFLSVMLEPVKMTAGVEMQLSTNQAVFLYKQPGPEAFFRKLESTEILRPALDAPVQTAPRACPVCGSPLQENARFCLHCMTSLEKKEPAPAAPVKRKKRWLVIGASAVLAVAAAVALLLFFRSPSPVTYTDYDTFYEAVQAASEKLELDALWSPEAFLDVQYDARTHTQKYTAPLELDGARLDFFMRDDGCVVTLILSDVPAARLDDAKKICAAVHGAVTNYFSDILNVLTDDETYLRKTYGEPFVPFFADMTGRTERYEKALAEGAAISTRYIEIEGLGRTSKDSFTVYFETGRDGPEGTLYDLILRFDYKGNEEVLLTKE